MESSIEEPIQLSNSIHNIPSHFSNDLRELKLIETEDEIFSLRFESDENAIDSTKCREPQEEVATLITKQ